MSDGRRTHDQASVLDALCAYKEIGKLLNALRLAFHNDHLETSVMVEVGVYRGNNLRMMLVLNFRQFFRKEATVVVVNQRDRPNHFSIRSQNCGGHKAIANEVTKCLRTIGIPLALDKPVESL